MGYAKRTLKPLNKVAIIDSETIAAIAALVPGGGITLSQVKADTDIASAISLKHASGSDNQDLSGKVDKVTGKGLSTEDYTTAEKSKLAGVSVGLTQSQILIRQL